MKWPPNITEKQANVIGILNDQTLKRVTTYVFLAVFIAAFGFTIGAFFIFPENQKIPIITGAFDILLSPTVFLMSKHFFAAKASAKLYSGIENGTK